MRANRQSAASGADLIQALVGSRIVSLRRHVLFYEPSRDENGHGITEVHTSLGSVVIGAGPNDDSIVVAAGPLEHGRLDPAEWTTVVADSEGWWLALRDHTIHLVDIFTNGLRDVAYVFRLNPRERFSVVLCNGDLLFGRDLERFRDCPEGMPRFRARIR